MRGLLDMMAVRLALVAVAVAVAALIVPGPAPAQDAGARGARLALLISTPVTRPGATAERSLRPVSDQLTRLGFSVLTLETADGARIRRGVSDFTSKVKPGSTALLLFRGAMLRLQKSTYLIPADARGGTELDASEAGIDLNRLENELTRKGATIKVLIVDAARSEAIAERFGVVAGGPAALELHNGTLAIVNTAPPRSARERNAEPRPGEDDLFLDELMRQTALPDVTLEQAFAKTRMAVATASGRRQVPSVSSALSSDYYITRGAAPPAQSPAPPDKPAATAAGTPDAPVGRALTKGRESEAGEPEPADSSSGPGPGEIFKDCGSCPELVVVPAGSFTMGAADNAFEQPAHRVDIARPFAIGRHEVTFAQWDACVAAGACKADIDDHGFGRGERPVIDVTWDEAQAFVKWLSSQTRQSYRLPSEAEWEYAARAGSRTPFPWGAAAGSGRANCSDCGSDASGSTLPVGSFKPNAFGVFDMVGNAAEFVDDCWNAGYRSAPADGSPWRSGQCQMRVLRGGSFAGKASAARSSSRFRYDRDVRYYTNGFRVARNVP